jgi:hypothetical protein
MDNNGNMFDKHEDVPENYRSKIVPSCFPPANAEALGLDKWCVSTFTESLDLHC